MADIESRPPLGGVPDQNSYLRLILQFNFVLVRLHFSCISYVRDLIIVNASAGERCLGRKIGILGVLNPWMEFDKTRSLQMRFLGLTVSFEPYCTRESDYAGSDLCTGPYKKKGKRRIWKSDIGDNFINLGAAPSQAILTIFGTFRDIIDIII